MASLACTRLFHGGRLIDVARVNVIYKFLFNDAVAMNSGQPVECALQVPEMTRELQAEGLVKVVAADEPNKYHVPEVAARLPEYMRGYGHVKERHPQIFGLSGRRCCNGIKLRQTYAFVKPGLQTFSLQT
jgi:TPP-dependent indolepyruvate ferredoxin oxidoreductase alpha subunit